MIYKISYMKLTYTDLLSGITIKKMGLESGAENFSNTKFKDV